MFSSHILCKVNDLDQAVSAWRDAGFTTNYGDTPHKSMNAIVWFETGPFIELIDAERAQPPAVIRWLVKIFSKSDWVRRFENWKAADEGWCDFALECEGSVVPHQKRYRAAGIPVFGPVSKTRTPPDSASVRFQTSFPHDFHLPILMGAYRPDPRPKAISHANGATSVASVTISVPDAVRDIFSQLVDEDDQWLNLVSGNGGVESVTLHGLFHDIAPDAINGAIIGKESR